MCLKYLTDLDIELQFFRLKQLPSLIILSQTHDIKGEEFTFKVTD